MKKCKIDECRSGPIKYLTRGYCNKHYRRVLKHGSPNPENHIEHRTKWPIEERFMDSVMPITETGCWIWLGMTNRAGYGRFYMDGKMMLAHRVAKIIFSGLDIKNKLVLHRCDTPCCVNPDHTYVGNHVDNMRDCIKKGRFIIGENHANAKLTEKQAKQIKYSDVPHTLMAQQMNVSETTIRFIRDGKRWGHI